MKNFNFGIVAAPNIDEPVRMTLFVKVGSKTFAYQATAQQLENLRDRKVLPDSDLDTSGLEVLSNL